jgi:hypothetical protein
MAPGFEYVVSRLPSAALTVATRAAPPTLCAQLKAKLRWTVVRRVFREAIMSYSRMVRSTLRSVAQDMMLSGGQTKDYSSLMRYDQAMFRGDISEQITDHKLSILQREFPEKYHLLENTVRKLQCKVRVRRAKMAFACRKQVCTVFPSPVVPHPCCTGTVPTPRLLNLQSA